MLSSPVASQALQPVPWRAPQILQGARRVQEEKLAVCLALEIGCQTRNPLSLEDPPRQGVPEATDHGGRLWYGFSNVKRY